MDLYNFVNSLFDRIKEKGVSGTYISMPYGMVKVDVMPIDNKVYIRMNNDEMGYFEEVNNRNFSYYIFHQQHRDGIRRGLTATEKLMKNICDMNELIDFHSA
jgi:hypothetical protein